jgi:hypothetical protein
VSSSGSFWSQIRWRLGGSDALLSQISDLIQKQIDANSDAQEVTEENILNPIVISPSKLVFRDNLFKGSRRTIGQGLVSYLPIDPDLDVMRLWMHNDHGGRYLTDYSMMDNRIQLNGSDQSKLLFTTDYDGIVADNIVNRFLDDQYLRVEDKDSSPNPNVRIKEIAGTGEGVSIFIRLYVENSQNELEHGMPGVLFSKIDTEQVDYAYAAYLRDNGAVEFIVRKGAREYTLTAPADTVQWANIEIPDFLESDFHPLDFYTTRETAPVPDPIPYTDLCFTFKFSDNTMQIVKDATVVASTATSPEGTGLVGRWRMNEGGDIGDDPDDPQTFTRTVFNSVATGNNGTITNATWDGTWLNFDGNNDLMDVTNYTAIQDLSAFTVSFWYYPKAVPSTDGYLARKGSLTASSWLVYHMSTGVCRFSVWNATPTRFDINFSSAFPALDTWYHIVAKYTIGAPGKIFVNNVKVTGGGNITGTVDTGTNVLRSGGTTTSNTPTGRIQDLMIFNRELSDADVTALYNAGHPTSYFPPWEANPPSAPPAPGPITNPFESVYNVPVPAAGEQDLVRLHAITVSSLTSRYSVGQGAQQDPGPVSEDGQYYSNDPTYDAGTQTQEVLSDYSTMTTTGGQYVELSNTKFGGERFLTGINVIGKPITKVVVKMADVNPTSAPATGTVVAKIKKNSDNTLQSTSSTVDATTLANNATGTSTSLWTDVTFTFTNNTYNMANNDRIQFEYDWNGDDSGGGGGGSPPGILASYYNYLNATRINAGTVNWDFKEGEKFGFGSMIGDKVTGVIVKMCDGGTTAATGNVTCRLISSAGTTYATATYPASSLADNAGAANNGPWTDVVFVFSAHSHNIGMNDRIQFEYDVGGSGGDFVGVALCNNITSEGNFFYIDSGAPTTVVDEGSVDVCMDVYIE